MIEQIDKIVKVDGRKKNGGHPNSRKTKGSRSVATVVKESMRQIELAEVQYSIKSIARKLINSQTVTALGTWEMAIVVRSEGKLEYIRVRDEKEIQRLLEEGKHGVDYVIIAGQDPDWKAADSLLNRAGLKPKEDTAPPGTVTIFTLVQQLQNANNRKDN